MQDTKLQAGQSAESELLIQARQEIADLKFRLSKIENSNHNLVLEVKRLRHVLVAMRNALFQSRNALLAKTNTERAKRQIKVSTTLPRYAKICKKQFARINATVVIAIFVIVGGILVGNIIAGLF